MPISVQCVNCDAKYRVAEKFAGRPFRCRTPGCNTKTVVPKAEELIAAGFNSAPHQAEPPPSESVPVPLPIQGAETSRCSRSICSERSPEETLVTCGQCGNQLVNDADIADKIVECPHCGTNLRMPTLISASAESRVTAAVPTSLANTNCPMCSESVNAHAKRCKHCGEWLDLDSRERNRGGKGGDQRHEDLSPGEAFSFAFRCRNWFSSAIVAGFLIYLPVVGRITVRGWRLEIARRVFAGEREPLPGFENFGGKILDGLRLRLVWSIYQLPFLMANTFLAILPLIMMWALLQGDSWDDAKARFKTRLAMWTIQIVISLALEVWLLVGQLLFWAGMVRYLQSGRWFAFFEILDNGRLIFANIGLFVVFFVWGSLSHFLWKLVQSALIASGVATVFVPLLTSPPWNWYRGHLWGQLARIISERECAAEQGD